MTRPRQSRTQPTTARRSRRQPALIEQALTPDPGPSCAPLVAAAVRQWRKDGYPGATETTRRLLGFWFGGDHTVGDAPFRFYAAQRAAVESLIYVYEVLRLRDNWALMQAFISDPQVRLLQYGGFARYGVKMATGSGKTMVMALAVVWSYLNAVNETPGETAGESDGETAGDAGNVPGPYASSFLLIAPNVIVFERLHTDFAGGKIFNEYPLIPPEYQGQWAEMRFFMRGDAGETGSRGALYLTNIQQLFEARAGGGGRRKGGMPAPIAAFMPERASDAPEQRDDFDGRAAGRQRPVMVLNDEAHHTHDETLEWNRVIRRLREQIGAGRFMAQLDFTATPRFTDGKLFPWVIYDYPLAQAIKDGIVKRPIKGEIRGASEAASPDATIRYAAYLTAAVNRWREYRDQLAPLKKKPVLFVMMASSKDADAVGKYLQEQHSDYFGGEKLQVIHIKGGDKGDGTITDKDLQRARDTVKDIDSEFSKVNAVVSVMMLREGWDVRNVTVVLGLRAYSAAANILPEQAIGRGLRLMFPGQAAAALDAADAGDGAAANGEAANTAADAGGRGSGYAERVDVIGTEGFMQFVADLEREEGLALETEDIGRVPIVIVSIHPDPDKAAMDIALPNISPIYESKSDTRAAIAGLNVDDIRIENLPFSLDPPSHAEFTYQGQDALTEETLLRRTYHLPNPTTCNEVISHYAGRIADELRLPGHFEVINGKLREFLMRRAFGRPVNLEDNELAPALAHPAVGVNTIGGFTRALRPLLRQERAPALGGEPWRMAAGAAFPWSRPSGPAGKTVFNLVAADNHFELDFANFLERAPDVARFAKLPLNLGFKIQYIANTGNLRHYYPDFAAVDTDGRHYLLETKGQEDTNVANKDRAARLWCRNAAALTGVSWQFVKIAQVDFRDSGVRTLSDIARAFAIP